MSFSLNVKLELKCLLRYVFMKLTMIHIFRVSHSQTWLCGVGLLQVNSQSLCDLPPVFQPHPRMALESRATGLCSDTIQDLIADPGD
jgi:hypothetical protein